MTALTDRQTGDLLALLNEIDSEMLWKSRKQRVMNLTRRARLIINKAKRRSDDGQ